jgi:hypothetical protein
VKDGERQTEINITSMKVYNGQEDKEERQSKRTTSQLVLATGLNLAKWRCQQI